MRVRALLRAALLPVLAATVPFLAAAQQPTLSGVEGQPAPSATFQVEVNFVDIDAVVTDERENSAGNLTKDDFDPRDDGKPQDISAFSLVDIPLPAAGARPRPVAE